MNLQTGHFKSVADACAAFRTASCQRRIVTFWHGLWLTYARDLPFSVVQMTLYMQLWDMAGTGALYRGGWIGAACGTAAAATASWVTAPVDFLRTRAMEGGHCKQTPGNVFAGVLPRVITAALGGFVFFGAYEACKSFASSLLG